MAAPAFVPQEFEVTYDAAVDALVATVGAYNPGGEESLIREACAVAARAHRKQMRLSGEPYIMHPLAVAMIVAELKLDVDSIITAVLHDTVEDTRLSLTDLEDQFGPNVARLVDGVTKLAQVARVRGSSSQAENLQKFVLAIASDVRVLLVKLCDRLHNMRTLHYHPKLEKRERIARETLEIYAPLARRMGIDRICGELEDLSFQWVSPDAYESINRRLALAREARREAVAEVSGAILRSLEKDGVNAGVYGREKRAYSIWRKLERRGVDFDDLADVYAFRVITENVDDCYRALGVIHKAWRCVPERFKDFISTPKPNNYRSIHTTVIGPDNQRTEIQIRTAEMDRIADAGVAAHWRYKDASYSYDAAAAKASGGDPLDRLRTLVDILDAADDPDEFLEHAKLEMFADQVFAFTPKGRMISLPRGATPLDFAYAVHTELGDTCVGAKINGRQRPVRTPLVNGDMVEIIRGGAPAILPGWEDIAVTGRARSAIRRLIRRAQRDEFARVGRAIAERAMRRAKHTFDGVNLDEALKRLEYREEDDLYADMGRGRLTARAFLDALFPGREVTDFEFDEDRDRIADETADLYVSGRSLSPGAVLRLAKCCSPVPGDRIVGILSKEGGVDVHTISCDRLAAVENEQDRWVDLGWTAEAVSHSLSVGRILAVVQHERGALAQIASAVAESQGDIIDVDFVRRSTDFYDMMIDVEVKDARHLSHIVAAMRACSAVVKADRAQDQSAGEGKDGE